MITHPRQMVRAALWGFASDREPDIEQVTRADIPCHVLWANHDTLLARSDGQEFARRLHASFTVASGPKVTHDWMFDAPELFAQHLAAPSWLARRTTSFFLVNNGICDQAV